MTELCAGRVRGGVVDACGGGVGGRVVAALVVECVGVSSRSVLLLRSGGIAGCARPLGSLAFCESGDELVDGGITVMAVGESRVVACGVDVRVRDKARVWATGSCVVSAQDEARVWAGTHVSVHAYDKARVWATGSCVVSAQDEARVWAARVFSCRRM